MKDIYVEFRVNTKLMENLVILSTKVGVEVTLGLITFVNLNLLLQVA